MYGISTSSAQIAERPLKSFRSSRRLIVRCTAVTATASGGRRGKTTAEGDRKEDGAGSRGASSDWEDRLSGVANTGCYLPPGDT
jgi:hypothetical protein